MSDRVEHLELNNIYKKIKGDNDKDDGPKVKWTTSPTSPTIVCRCADCSSTDETEDETCTFLRNAYNGVNSGPQKNGNDSGDDDDSNDSTHMFLRSAFSGVHSGPSTTCIDIEDDEDETYAFLRGAYNADSSGAVNEETSTTAALQNEDECGGND